MGWGTQHPSPKRGGASSPIFGPFLLWPNGCMDQDATSYGGRPRPTRRCVRCGLSYPPLKRAHPPHPIFGPCLLWPNGWMDEDAAWYGSSSRPRPHCTRRVPAPAKGAPQHPPPILAHVYCGHGRPSPLLLSSCFEYCVVNALCNLCIIRVFIRQ